MMKCFIVTTLSIILFWVPVFGQKDSSGTKISSNKFIRLNYENDFFTQTDDYYTQGIKLESVDPAFRYSPVMWLLPQLANATVQYGLSAVQDCFTPTSITSNTILYGDHPFAGYIYLGIIKYLPIIIKRKN